MVIIFLGPPGSGKDTQANLLAKDYGFAAFSPGEVLRDHIDAGGKYAAELERYMSAGQLAPDRILQELLIERVKSLNNPNIVLAGAVRALDQVEVFEKIMATVGMKIDHVIFLELDDEGVRDRLSGRLYSPASGKTYHQKYNPPKVSGKDDDTGEELERREDDSPAGIEARLKRYHGIEEAVVEHYRAQGILRAFDARMPIPELHSQIAQALGLKPRQLGEVC
jgi:adenylate kinase